MISVYAPLATTSPRRYAYLQGTLLGPINIDSSPDRRENSFSWEPPTDLFVQGSAYKETKEKPVDQVKTHGTFTFLGDARHFVYSKTQTTGGNWEGGKYLTCPLKRVSNGRYESLSIPAAAFGFQGCDRNWDPHPDIYGRIVSSYINWSGFYCAGDSVVILGVAAMAESAPFVEGGYRYRITDGKIYTVLWSDIWTCSHESVNATLQQFVYNSTNKQYPFGLNDVLSNGFIESIVKSLPCTTSNVTLPCLIYECDKENVSSRGDVQEQIESLVATRLLTCTQGITPYDYGELAMEASANARTVDTNVISFVKDLRDPAALIPKLKNLKSLKGIASQYLGTKYGILPTVDDLNKISDGFKKIKPLWQSSAEFLRAGHTTNFTFSGGSSTLVQRIKISVDDEDSMVQKLYQGAVKIGIFPTLVNLWDLVPYSFVIDWFVDVGGLLERIDNNLLFKTLNINYVVTSSKSTTILSISDPQSGITGNYYRVAYHRGVSDQCPTPSLTLQLTSKDFDHYVEASALIIQRR